MYGCRRTNILASHERKKEREFQMNKVLMRNRICVLLILVVFLSAAGFGQSQDLKVRVKVRKANIREKPSMDGEIIAVVSRGRVLEVDGKQGDWYLIRLPLHLEGYSLPGYIHKNTVIVLGEELPEMKSKASRQKTEGGFQKYGASALLGSANPTEREYFAGLYFSGNFSYRLSEKFSLELTLDVFGSKTDGSSQGLSAGTLTVLPVHLSAQWRIPLEKQTQAYVAGGIGFNIISFSLEDTSLDREESADNTLAFHLAGGVEYLFKRNLAVRADLKYIFMSTEGSWSYTDPVLGRLSGSIDSINLNSLLIGIGITYYF
jgi:outer membrane protein W